jgi:hypothetical protein
MEAKQVVRIKDTEAFPRVGFEDLAATAATGKRRRSSDDGVESCDETCLDLDGVMVSGTAVNKAAEKVKALQHLLVQLMEPATCARVFPSCVFVLAEFVQMLSRVRASNHLALAVPLSGAGAVRGVIYRVPSSAVSSVVGGLQDGAVGPVQDGQDGLAGLLNQLCGICAGQEALSRGAQGVVDLAQCLLLDRVCAVVSELHRGGGSGCGEDD